jgi:hypothetical protein
MLLLYHVFSEIGIAGDWDRATALYPLKKKEKSRQGRIRGE